MTEVQVFDNPDFGSIRGILIDGEPWWVGKDIADALGYKNGSRDINRHVDVEDRKVGYRNGTPSNADSVANHDVPSVKDALGRDQYPTWINESGLYSLILASKLPTAKKFKRWVTSEVLPAIRKTGKYAVKEEPKEEPQLAEQRQLTSDDYIRAASIIAGCRNERLPIVVNLLAQGGINVPRIKSVKGNSIKLEDADTALLREEDGTTAAMINEAIAKTDLNQNRIAALCGLHPTQIMRIRKGEVNPPLERAELIQKALREVLGKTE